MSKTETRTLYTVEEIRESFPDAYDKIRENWVESIASDPHMPWSDEIMDSLRATVKACGARLDDCSIWPYSYSYLSVTVDDFYEDGEEIQEKKDSAWLFSSILRPLGYKPCPERGVSFPGLYPFTGVCFDEDFIQSVYEDMRAGCSLSEALENLAGVASRMMENEIESIQEEDYMLDSLADRWYTSDGDEA